MNWIKTLEKTEINMNSFIFFIFFLYLNTVGTLVEIFLGRAQQGEISIS